MIKNRAVPLVLSVVMVFCSGCGGWFEYKEPEYELIENYEEYAELFEECGVEAKIVTEEESVTEKEKEYLQIIFPDQTTAGYRKGLEYIKKDLEREESGELLVGQLEIEVKSEEEAKVSLDYYLEDGQWKGSTYVRYVPPDFTDILPTVSIATAQDDSMALLIIEKWITEEELADLYRTAKDMEQKMLEYEPEPEE